MLFIGNLEMAGQTLDVVDGQQRLTIITILFSAISDHFREISNLILLQIKSICYKYFGVRAHPLIEHTAVNRGGVGSSQLGELKKSPYTSAFTGFCYTQDRREGFEKAMYC